MTLTDAALIIIAIYCLARLCLMAGRARRNQWK